MNLILQKKVERAVRLIQSVKNMYEWVCREIFFESNTKWNESKNGFFDDEEGFHKRFLEDYFHIKLEK